MAKTPKIPAKLQPWVDVRNKFKLTNCHIQMARELNLNPKKFGEMANVKGKDWKLPLPKFIESSYFKRFKKDKPDVVISIEEKMARIREKKKEKKKRKELENSDPAEGSSTEL